MKHFWVSVMMSNAPIVISLPVEALDEIEARKKFFVHLDSWVSRSKFNLRLIGNLLEHDLNMSTFTIEEHEQPELFGGG